MSLLICVISDVNCVKFYVNSFNIYFITFVSRVLPMVFCLCMTLFTIHRYLWILTMLNRLLMMNTDSSCSFLLFHLDYCGVIRTF